MHDEMLHIRTNSRPWFRLLLPPKCEPATVQTERTTAIQTLKSERLSERSSGFNPVSGLPAGDPWAHQKTGMRPQAKISAADTACKADPAVKAASMQQVYEMRKDRIASHGLSAAAIQKGGGTAADCLRWG